MWAGLRKWIWDLILRSLISDRLDHGFSLFISSRDPLGSWDRDLNPLLMDISVGIIDPNHILMVGSSEILTLYSIFVDISFSSRNSCCYSLHTTIVLGVLCDNSQRGVTKRNRSVWIYMFLLFACCVIHHVPYL